MEKHSEDGVTLILLNSETRILSEEVFNNAALPLRKKIQKAEEILGRKFTPQENKTLFLAHHYGNSGIYEYTFREVLTKVRLLHSSGFTKKECRKLMEYGIVGKTGKPISQAEIIDPLALPQLLKKTPAEFQLLMNFELSKFKNPEQNLMHLFRGIRKNEEHYILNAANKIANRWLGDMFKNINVLVKYLEQYPNRNRLRGWRISDGFDKTIALELKEVMEIISNLKKERGFIITYENASLLQAMVLRIQNIPN